MNLCPLSAYLYLQTSQYSHILWLHDKRMFVQSKYWLPLVAHVIRWYHIYCNYTVRLTQFLSHINLETSKTKKTHTHTFEGGKRDLLPNNNKNNSTTTTTSGLVVALVNNININNLTQQCFNKYCHLNYSSILHKTKQIFQ